MKNWFSRPPQGQLDPVEQQLRENRPASPEFPPGLHASIMRAVREHRPTAPQSSQSRLPWWLPVPAMAAVLLAAGLYFWPDPIDSSNATAALSSAVSSVEKGVELARLAPETVVAPLSDELTRLRGDVENAKSFLMSSVP
jgi:hypothetical protein